MPRENDANINTNNNVPENNAPAPEAPELVAWKDEINKQVAHLEADKTVYRYGGPKLSIKGSIDQTKLNNIDIPEDKEKGLTSDIITLVTFGAYLDKDYEDRINRKGPGFDARYYLFSNVISSSTPRENKYQMALFESRQEAKKAIEEYKNGNDRNVQRYLNNAAKFIGDQAVNTDIQSNHANHVYNGFIDLVNRTKNEDIFVNAKNTMSRKIQKKMNERAILANKINESILAEKQLSENLPPAGSKEREELVRKVMTAGLMTNYYEKVADNYSQAWQNSGLMNEIATDKFYEDNLRPFVVENNAGNDEELRKRWKDYLWIHVSQNALMNQKYQYNSYQTDMLSGDSELSQKDYYDKLNLIIDQSDVYRELMQETDLGKFATSINKAKDCKFNIETANSNGEIEKKTYDFSMIFNESEATIGRKIEPEQQQILKSIIDDSIEFGKNTLLEVMNPMENEELALKGNAVGQAVQKYIRENHLVLDTSKAYCENGNNRLDGILETCGEVVKYNTPLYVKSKNEGFVKFIINIENDNVNIDHEVVGAIPYNPNNYVSDSDKNKINAEVAKLEADKQPKELLEARQKLMAYGNMMYDAFDDENVTHEEYSALLDSMRDLFNKLENVYRENENGTTSLKPESKEEYDSLREGYQNVANLCNKYLNANPYDQLAVEINKFINRDLSLLNQVDLSKEETSIEDQLAITASIIAQPELEEQPGPASKSGPVTDEEWKAKIPQMNFSYEENVKKYTGSVIKPRESFVGGERLKKIEIKPDEAFGITEDVIQAITMGGYCSKDGVLRHENPIWKMNPQSYLLDGFETDMGYRHEEVFMPLFDARQKVATGFENLKKGDSTIIDNYAKSFVDFVQNELLYRDPSIRSAGSINYSLFKLVNNVAKSEIFKNAPFPEEVLEKTKEIEELGRLKRQAYEIENKLADDLPPGDSNQRKEMVLDLLLAKVVEKLPEKYCAPINDGLANYPGFNQENTGAGSLFNEQEYDKVIEAMKRTLPADNPHVNDNKRTAKITWPLTVAGQIATMKERLCRAGVTYQTKMLADDFKKDQYYSKIKDMIASSDMYREMVVTNDSKKLKKLIDSVTDDINNLKVKTYTLENGKVKTLEKTIDVNDIPETDEDKKIISDVIEKESNKLPSKIEEVEKRALDHMADASRTYLVESKTDIFEKLIKEKIKQLNLNLDTTVCFTKGFSEAKKLNDAAENAEKNKNTIYIKNRDGGLCGFSLDKDASGNPIVVEQTGLKAIPYNSEDYIKENYNYKCNAFYAELGIKADKPEYSASYRGLESYIKVMEAAAGNIGKSPEYSLVLDNLNSLNAKLTSVYDQYQQGKTLFSRAEYTELHTAYTACKNALNKYWEKNPFDKCAEAVTKMIDGDLKAYNECHGDPNKKNIRENVNLIYPILANKKDLVKDKIDKGIVEEQNYLLSSKKALVGKTGIQAVNSEMVDSAIRQYFVERNKDMLTLDSNGKYIKNDKGEYLQTDGTYYTRKMQADYISAHREDFDKYIKDSFISYRDIHKDSEINPDAMSKFLKDKGVEGVIEDPVARNARKERSISLEKSYREFLTKKELEKIISVEQNGGKLEREQYNFLKLDGSIKSREYNRKLSENMASGEPAKVKEAYEMILDSLMENNLKEFDINDNSNNSLLYKDPEKVFNMQTQLAETQAVLDKAKQAGVNFANPKYKELIDKSGVSESLAFLWGRRINMELSPANDYFDYRKSDKMPYEKIENIAQEANSISEGTKAFEWDKPGAKPSFDMIAVGLKNMEQFYGDVKKNQKNWALKGSDKSFEQKLDAAQKILSKSTKIAPEDEKLVEFRNRLVNHKITSLIGKKHKDSEFYKNIVKAIDAYRAAPDGNKETKRGELLDACGKYVSNRRSGAERTKIVRELGKYVFGEMEAFSREHDNNSKKLMAEKLVDAYEDTLRKISKLPNHKQAAESVLEGFTDAGKRVLVNKLMDTDICIDMSKHPDNVAFDDKNILTEFAKVALEQVVEKNSELEALVLDRKEFRLQAPANQGPNNPQ